MLDWIEHILPLMMTKNRFVYKYFRKAYTHCLDFPVRLHEPSRSMHTIFTLCRRKFDRKLTLFLFYSISHEDDCNKTEEGAFKTTAINDIPTNYCHIYPFGVPCSYSYQTVLGLLS